LKYIYYNLSQAHCALSLPGEMRVGLKALIIINNFYYDFCVLRFEFTS